EKNPQKTDSLVIGSATHLVIKKMDLEKEITEKTINQAIDELVNSRCISAQIAKKINIASIMKFFRSDLGKILNGNNRIMREWPFTYAASVSQVYPEKKNFDDEKIIIQGIIDMLVQTSDKAIIIDFKTDNINSAKVSQRAENYKTQIEWYCKAAGVILGLKKVEGWLYFLNASESVKVV
ncbi:MAG: PD-(D/E)XK nuclease family protein, partial [Phycisphaerales bacterium]